MCNYQSFVVVRTFDGTAPRILFCETDSHEEIVQRASLNDTDTHIRYFARVECLPPFARVDIDEREVPAWYAENRAEIDARVIEIAKQRAPLDAEYEKQCAPLDAEWISGLAKIDGYVMPRPQAQGV